MKSLNAKLTINRDEVEDRTEKDFEIRLDNRLDALKRDILRDIREKREWTYAKISKEGSQYK